MRPYYISKNRYGFYSVCFVNQTTGKKTPWKSTHSADYSEAMMIASQWLRDGTPAQQARTALRMIDAEKMDASLKWKLGNKVLYDTYLKWCNKNNERALSHKGLSMRMQEKGFKRCVSNSRRFWVGLVLRNEWRG